MKESEHYLILGLGLTGVSVARYLHTKNIPFSVIDSRQTPPGLAELRTLAPNVHVAVGELTQTMITSEVSHILFSPGVPPNTELMQLAKNRGIQCLGDIELFAQVQPAKPVVAITGSNGKSTVTTLVAEMARACGAHAYAGGNLAPPALALLDKRDAELYVLELSSFQLEMTSTLRPEVAVVLNISPDHLDRHTTLQKYADIKMSVYDRARHCLVNRDDPLVSNFNHAKGITTFGLGTPNSGHFGVSVHGNKEWLCYGDQHLLLADEIKIKGKHGVANALAALAIIHLLKLDMRKAVEVLKHFHGLPHRFQLVASNQGVDWINDSKGTNIGAAIASINSVSSSVILIAGGIFKGGDLNLLQRAVKNRVRCAILLGKDATTLGDSLQEVTEVRYAADMRVAVRIAHLLVKSGDTVLLSPACASFDMYQNYMHRGEDFSNLVRQELQEKIDKKI